MNILVAGANGFVGERLIKLLTKKGHHVTALVRSRKKNIKKSENVTWIQGDLLQKQSLAELKDVDLSFYLVHGLKADELQFEYEESLAAVNFINWIRKTECQIVYLGALGDETEALSQHLRSRQLTGAILGASGLPTLEFRASIILGEGSLSFEMIKAISERFPFRPRISILEKPCQPLALDDLLHYLEKSLEYIPQGHEVVEIGGPEVVTYGDLIDIYAELSGLYRKVIKLPDLDVKVLMHALDYSIPEHSQIGKKLAGSLGYPTVVTSNAAKEIFPDVTLTDITDAMNRARKQSKTHYSPIWEKDFVKMLLSDKILAQAGLIPSEILNTLEKVGRFKKIFSKK